MQNINILKRREEAIPFLALRHILCKFVNLISSNIIVDIDGQEMVENIVRNHFE